MCSKIQYIHVTCVRLVIWMQFGDISALLIMVVGVGWNVEAGGQNVEYCMPRGPV